MNSITAFELQDILVKLMSVADTTDKLSLKSLHDWMKLNDTVVEFRIYVDSKEDDND